MFHHCKLCGNCLLYHRTIQLFNDDLTIQDIYEYHCHLCPEFKIFLNSDYSIESEFILIKNFSFLFNPCKRKAYVQRHHVPSRCQVVKTIPLNELTHELAVQWVNKLNIYALFQ